MSQSRGGMQTRRSFVQRAALVVSALSIPVAWLPPAAAFPVIDVSSVGQLVLQLTTTIQQVEQTRRQVEALHAAARQLDPRSFRTVEALLRGDELRYQTLTGDVRTLGYTLERVNAQFRRLFPEEPTVRNQRPRDYQTVSRDLDREIYDSALVAARAQSSLTTIEANNNEAQRILSESEGNDSQVAQLQSALQMLALVHQNLAAITQTINSGSRVSSEWAAAGVTERRIAAEKRRRLLRDHSRSAPSPGIDRRFLQ